jgi:predicted MPP superfamily phosphohydrolase
MTVEHIFFALIILLFLSLQFFLWRRFVKWTGIALTLRAGRWSRRLLGLIFLVANSLVPLRIYFADKGDFVSFAAVSSAYLQGYFVAVVIFSSVLLGTIAILRFQYKMLRDFWRRLRGKKKKEFSPTRRSFIRNTGIVTISAITGIPAAAVFARPRESQIIARDIVNSRLPASLEGLRIAHISDIHAGFFMPEREIFVHLEKVNTLNADLICITGDFVDSHIREVALVRDQLRQLRAPFGVYGVLGNHDHYANAGFVTKELGGVIRLLNNAHHNLQIRGQGLTIIGIDDAGSGSGNYANLPRAIAGVPADNYRLLLSHRPHMFNQARQAGIPLTLAGHTHGGQVPLGWDVGRLNTADLFLSYVAGLYEREGMHLYVNTGLGMSVAPIRTIAPEITLLTLRRR